MRSSVIDDSARWFPNRTPELNREKAAIAPGEAIAARAAPRAPKPRRPTDTSGRKTFLAFLAVVPMEPCTPGSDTFQTWA